MAESLGPFKGLMHTSLEDWIQQQEEELGPLSGEEKEVAGYIKELLSKKDKTEIIKTLLDFKHNKEWDQTFSVFANTIGQSWNMRSSKMFNDFKTASKLKNQGPLFAEI